MTQIIDCPPSKPAPIPTKTLDFEAIKAKQRATWASGDFAVIGTTLQLVGETLCEAANVASGSHVLDVACGNGNASLAAARRYASVVGVDYVPELLVRARERAHAERLSIAFIEGDAEQLPFGAASFDTVLSTFGVMFAPNQTRVAEELLRVCKPGGTIALANWTPEGFLGDWFRTTAQYAPPPSGLPSPFAWGREGDVSALFGSRARVISAKKKDFVFRYESPAHFVRIFRTFYGPTYKVFEALDETGKERFHDSLVELISRQDRRAGNATAVPAEYLEIVLQKT